MSEVPPVKLSDPSYRRPSWTFVREAPSFPILSLNTTYPTDSYV